MEDHTKTTKSRSLQQKAPIWETLQEKLTWSNASAGDFFGQSVSIWDSRSLPIIFFRGIFIRSSELRRLSFLCWWKLSF